VENGNRGKPNKWGISCGIEGSFELKPVIVPHFENLLILVYLLYKIPN